MQQLTYVDLRAAVAGRTAGLRIRTELEPLGGPGDKIFPPTYEGGQYALEKRRVVGPEGRSETVEAVVLGSVADQANRQELALLEEKRAGAPIPVIATDFAGTSVADLGRVTSLEASHRMFDALFRDSTLDGTAFRKTEAGVAMTNADNGNATAILHHCPAGLVYGAWDSTGPKGGLGSKYERAITTEMVAFGVTVGSRTSSRIDPLGIEKAAGPLFVSVDDPQEWTVDPEQAEKDKKGEPVRYGKGGELGRPSQVNHGNVTPSIDEQAGGVTAERIVSTTVLSLVRLRQIRFAANLGGEVLAADQRAEAESAARAALAALALLGVAAGTEGGFDLRSRCVLVPTSAPVLELVGATTADRQEFELSAESMRALLSEAVDAVRRSGLSWSDDDLVLSPTEKLVGLIHKSRDLSAADPDAA